jgi:8-oxo-dGTP pyrophosphatase MutT (NUDIX family)
MWIESHYDNDGFWAGEGGGASGILPICSSTKRICLAWRSGSVHMGNCYGTLGGAIQRGMQPAESAKEEMKEETGYEGAIQLTPAYVFSSGNFKYFNFIGVVPTEFTFSPHSGHSWETSHIDWLAYEEIQKMMLISSKKFHSGLISLFQKSRQIIENIVGSLNAVPSTSSI